jgi:hypothetical protein
MEKRSSDCACTAADPARRKKQAAITVLVFMFLRFIDEKNLMIQQKHGESRSCCIIRWIIAIFMFKFM